MPQKPIFEYTDPQKRDAFISETTLVFLSGMGNKTRDIATIMYMYVFNLSLYGRLQAQVAVAFVTSWLSIAITNDLRIVLSQGSRGPVTGNKSHSPE